MERRKILTTAGRRDEEQRDRISTLPDEILHDILARVKSRKLAAEATVLSKRWGPLWRSYPILEFDDDDFKSEASLKTFLAAAAKKFSSHPQLAVIDAVAIECRWMHTHGVLWFSVLDELLGFAATRSPQKIQVTAPRYMSYRIPRQLLLPAAAAGQLCRIRDLRLQNCNFDRYADLNVKEGDDNNNSNNPFDCLRGSLRTLRLISVEFPADGGSRILNSMIAGASLLENLTLFSVGGIQRLQVRNLANLKALNVQHCDDLNDVDIAWLHSPLKDGAMKIESSPDFQSVKITHACEFVNREVNELISESPPQELQMPTRTDNLPRIHELKIVDNDKLRKTTLSSWGNSMMNHLPKLKLMSGVYIKTQFFPAMLSKDGKPFALVTFHTLLSHLSVPCDLGRLIPKLSQFWLTVKFDRELSNWGDYANHLKFPVVPMVEHMKISSNFFASCNNKDDFLDRVFCCCRSKFLSIST